jgi:hypothetical protein
MLDLASAALIVAGTRRVAPVGRALQEFDHASSTILPVCFRVLHGDALTRDDPRHEHHKAIGMASEPVAA